MTRRRRHCPPSPLRVRREADDILGSCLATVEAPGEAMTAAQVRDTISSRADVPTRLVGGAMENAGWEEANVTYRPARGQGRAKKRVYRRRGDRTLFARVRSHSPRRE